MSATRRRPVPLEIEFVPDALGIAFFRDLLDAIEARMTDAARDSGTVIALPFGMPDRLDTGYLAEAFDRAGALEPKPSQPPRPAFPLRRSRFRRQETHPGAPHVPNRRRVR